MMRPQLRASIPTPKLLRADDRAGEVQVEEALPRLERHRLGRDVLATAADVVDQDVNVPKAGEYLVTQDVGVGRIAQVGYERVNVVTMDQ